MRSSIIIALSILFLLPLNGFALDTYPLSDEAKLVMEEGILANEKLYDFIESHPCELGIIKKCVKPLSSQDLDELKKLLSSLEKWRRDALVLAMPENDVLNGRRFKLTLGENLSVTKKKRRNFLEITYNPEDPEAMLFTQGIRVRTATSLLLYDSFFRLAEILSKATKIRRLIAHDMPNGESILRETYSMAMERDLWDAIATNLNFLLAERTLRGARILSENELFFEEFVEKSFIGQKIKNSKFRFRIRNKVFLKGELKEMAFFEKLNRIVGRISKFFGNTAGRIQTRDGKLKKMALDPQVMGAMKSQLKPLDLLLEKTPMRLTDKFIPGYYGHVAVWLGTPEELMEVKVNHEGQLIALLEHPLVLPHLEKLSQGKLVVEALRKPGVTMNTLEQFMDIDDLLVLRSESYDPISLGEHLLRTFKQIGKAYDFNFNVETQKEIVCSELIYTIYTNESWPTTKSMGRHTISPDHVAWKALDSCFWPVLMYNDGKEITSGKSELMRDLLSRRGAVSYNSSGTCLETYGLKFSSPQ